MAIAMTQNLSAPSGVVATYFGSTGGSTTRYYWIQAIYASGKSIPASSNALASTLASLSNGNQVEVTWNPMYGAIGYNVYYTTTSTAPVAGAVAVASVTAPNFTDSGQSNSPGTGYVSSDGLRMARARYDFAVDGGGAPGLITLAVSDIIPDNAVICGGFCNSITAASTGSSPTIAIGTSAGSAANSLKAATASSTFSTDAIVALVPVWTAATAIKMTAAGTITITTATAALTAGVFDIVVFYYVATA